MLASGGADFGQGGGGNNSANSVNNSPSKKVRDAAGRECDEIDLLKSDGGL